MLGIAIGFGAQNLVQDFLAGIFILLEDQYGVGDVVDIGSVSGSVEAVSLRITRVRDVNGIVWHIRNGTIKKAGNETHGWARAVVDFPVPSGMPVATARRVLGRAAVEMAAERALARLDPRPAGGLGDRDDFPRRRADPGHRQDGAAGQAGRDQGTAGAAEVRA